MTQSSDNLIQKENDLAKLVLDVCFKVHRQYGPGLYESVYEEIVFFELCKEGLGVERQKGIPLVHETIKLDIGFRADMIVEKALLIEIKSIEALADIHYKQVQTYLKLTGIKLGLLINFNTTLLKNGIKRIINTF